MRPTADNRPYRGNNERWQLAQSDAARYGPITHGSVNTAASNLSRCDLLAEPGGLAERERDCSLRWLETEASGITKALKLPRGPNIGQL